MTVKPSIPEWFEDKGVLVTGATGFVGKLVVAKLLLISPKGGNIYLLIREKKGLDSEERLQWLIQQEPFRAVRENYPERLKRLIVITGDTTVEGFALSTVNMDRLVEDVSVIFHVAASVKFDLSLRDAVATNTKAVANIIALAEQLPKLKSLIHVSTAYCHCSEVRLEEKAYPTTIPAEDVLTAVDTLDDASLQAVESKLLTYEPNTYSLTKGLSEDLMVKSGLPVGIARPSIIGAAWKEPAPGWVDNINGPTGLIVGSGKGVIRSMLCNANHLIDVIPCDMVANAIVALSWKVGLASSPTPIFVNVTEGARNPMKWGWAINTGERIVKKNPFSGPLWYPGGRITSSTILHWLAVFFLHTIPAYFIDTVMLLTGNKPFLIRAQTKVASGLSLLQYYTTKNWIFINDGLTELHNDLSPGDKETFFMDTRNIYWPDYLYTYILGIRQFLLQDDPSTLPRARRVFKYLYIADTILRISIGAFIVWFIYSWIIPRNIITASIIETKDL